MSSDQSVPHSNPGNVTSILSLCSKVTLDGTNYNDWIRNIKMALRFEHKEYVLETELVEVDPETATPEEVASYTKHSDDATKVACIMIATMNPELQRIYEDYWPYEMHKELAEKFRKQERIERREVVKAFINGKPKEAEMPVHEDLAVDIVLNSLPSSYDQFTLAYHLNNNQATLAELHRMLRTAEVGMKGKGLLPVNPPVLAIGSGKGKKRKGPPKQNWREKTHVGSSSNAPKGKSSGIPHVQNPKDADCFYYKQKGHWKRSCPTYLQDIKDGKVKRHKQDLEESRELERGRLNLVMGNRRTSPVTKIDVYRLALSNGVRLDLHNCCYSPDMTKNIISFHALFKQGFYYEFDKLNGSIFVFKNNVFIFNAMPCDGVYESIMCVDNYGKNVFAIDASSGIEKACLWHCRLGHINKKRIAQLQKDGVLESFDLGSDDVCESCLFGKMTKSPFKGTFERGEGLLDIIHTDVCGPFRTTTKDDTRFYVTFTDDFSRYGYIYLIKNKSDTFEKFKEFKNKAENQLGRKIKIIRSDRGGEYLSIEFLDYLKECGIVSQLSPPRTP
ncbi:hypothetical protein L2E82_44271 [Cichorium intybus]|uniref:Uncharacterized protein n=1 Tax=Cichorium intybus TaxID=13427 RepID=A0ACB8ZUG4_CICIN|nr:hypothetical protein L2E82_44271 [Cichorium intybus]